MVISFKHFKMHFYSFIASEVSIEKSGIKSYCCSFESKCIFPSGCF